MNLVSHFVQYEVKDGFFNEIANIVGKIFTYYVRTERSPVPIKEYNDNLPQSRVKTGGSPASGKQKTPRLYPDPQYGPSARDFFSSGFGGDARTAKLELILTNG